MGKNQEQVVLVGIFEPRARKGKAGRLEKNMLAERHLLINLLRDSGFKCEPVNAMWPRNFFVCCGEKIYHRREHGNYSNGGFVRAFENFTLVCSAVSQIGRGLRHSTDYRIDKLEELYGDEIEVLPPPNLMSEIGLIQHLNKAILPVPKKEVVFVDSIYHRNQKENILRFVDRHDFKIVKVYDDFNRLSCPCDSLILDRGKKSFAFVNSNSQNGFIKNLSDYEIEALEVSFAHNCSGGGGLSRATNVVPREKLDEALSIFS